MGSPRPADLQVQISGVQGLSTHWDEVTHTSTSWMDERVVGSMFSFSFHRKFQLLFSSFKDHGTQYGLKYFFSNPASREKAMFMARFISVEAGRQDKAFFFFICFDKTAAVLFLLLVL